MKERYYSAELKANVPFDFQLPKEGSLSENWSVNFLILEITKPADSPSLTNLIFELYYRDDKERPDNLVTCHLIKYRKKFVFENGIYILYLDEIDEIPNKIKPRTFSLRNSADSKVTAVLYYSFKQE